MTLRIDITDCVGIADCFGEPTPRLPRPKRVWTPARDDTLPRFDHLSDCVQARAP